MSINDPAERIIFDGGEPFIMGAEPKIHFTNFYTPNRWRCELFGVGRYLTVWPLDGNVPNAFWRWMQFICFGDKWIKEEKK